MKSKATASTLVIGTVAYAFALATAIWLSGPACYAPQWAHIAFFGVLAALTIAVLLVPAPTREKLPARFILAAGAIVFTIFVRVLTTPLFPGLDYGGPDSFDSYVASVTLEWLFGSYFGSCSGLPDHW